MKRIVIAALTVLTAMACAFPLGASPAQAATGDPTLSWAYAIPNPVRGNQAVITASAAVVSPAVEVKKVCAAFDGVPVSADISHYSGQYFGDLTAGAGLATFDSATGCWNSTGIKSNNNSAIGPTALGLLPDTTKWADGTHTVTITITDDLGHSASFQTSFTTLNAAPTATVTNYTNGDTVSGQIVISVQGSVDGSGTAQMASWCVTRDGAKETQNVASHAGPYYGDLQSNNANFDAATGCWTPLPGPPPTSLLGGAVAYDTSTWYDGDHTIVFTLTDTTPRHVTVSITLHSSNNHPAPTPKASLTVTPKPIVVTTAATHFSARCGISIGTVHSCRVVAKAGSVVVASGTKTVGAGATTALVTLTVNAAGRAQLTAHNGLLQITLTATVTPGSGPVLTATATDSLVAKTVKVALASSVLFSSGSAVLTKSAVKLITELGKKVAGSKSASCAGYTDNQGSASYNLKLGMDRATAVCKILSKYIKKTTATSFGMGHPVATNTTEAGRAKNRRVVITITNA